MTDIFHVVMLSASLKRNSARPSRSVSTAGCQTRVSGNNSRSRGVESGLRAGPTYLTSTTVLTAEEVVLMSGDFPAVTSTASDAAATFNVMSTVVRFDDCTCTSLTT